MRLKNQKYLLYLNDKFLKMTFTDKNIIENYIGLFESLNSISKLELIEKLTKSLKA